MPLRLDLTPKALGIEEKQATLCQCMKSGIFLLGLFFVGVVFLRVLVYMGTLHLSLVRIADSEEGIGIILLFGPKSYLM